jgi:hypothetical protein
VVVLGWPSSFGWSQVQSQHAGQWSCWNSAPSSLDLEAWKFTLNDRSRQNYWLHASIYSTVSFYVSIHFHTLIYSSNKTQRYPQVTL